MQEERYGRSPVFELFLSLVKSRNRATRTFLISTQAKNLPECSEMPESNFEKTGFEKSIN